MLGLHVWCVGIMVSLIFWHRVSAGMPPKRGRPRPRFNPASPARDMSRCSLGELQKLSVAEIRAQLRSLSLPSTGTKKAMVGRLFEHFHPPSVSSGHSSLATPPSGGHPPSDSIEATVARLVNEGIQNALQGLSSQSNLSLPSRSPTALSDAGGTSASGYTPLPSGPDLVGTTVEAAIPPVPDSIKKKVEKGEYLDFNSLLQDNMYPLPGNDPSYTLSVCPDPDSSSQGVIISQARQKRPSITDLPTWLQAWNVYVVLVTYREPHRALDLLLYQRFICDVSTRTPPSAWLLYDKKFRLAAAANPHLLWGQKHTELWLECFTTLPQSSNNLNKDGPEAPPRSSSHKQARRPCTYCASLYHFPDNCPQNPFRGRGSSFKSSDRSDPTRSDTIRRGRPVCHDYNGPTGCRRKACNFRHQCGSCDGYHTKRDCPRGARF